MFSHTPLRHGSCHGIYQRLFRGLQFQDLAQRFSIRRQLWLGVALMVALILAASQAVWAEATTEAVQGQTLDQQLQAIKKEALALNRDLFVLKEELQFPANTQVAVFVSMDAGNLFALDAVNIKLDGNVVANHLYTERQVDALSRGGIQKVYMGNIKAGEHELVAVFTGRGPKGRDFRRATAHTFSKGSNASYLEITITDSELSMQPDFAVRDWQ